MHLAPLAAARNASPTRIGWCTLFTKAYSLVALRRPDLRRAYLGLPWGHLYEHPSNVASIAVERRLDGEDAVLFAMLRDPELLALTDLQREIDHVKHAPVESIAAFRRQLRTSQLPAFVRRLAWWIGLNTSGVERARHFGTFGISATAALGASQLLVLSPLTTTLYYGPFDRNNSLDMRLVFDHRVLDGASIARALAEMEATLLGDILAEVRGAAGRAAA